MEMTLMGNLPYLLTQGQRLLIDTGSPLSRSDAGFIKIEDQYCFLHRRAAESYGDPGREQAGGVSEGILGMDILKDHALLLDYEKWRACLDPRELGKPVFTAELDMEEAVPRIRGIFRGQERLFVLDTGSVLSYLREELTQRLPEWGWEQCFHPVYGPFLTPWYRMPVKIADKEFSLRFGKLPDYLEQPLAIGGADGVIGYEFLSLTQVVLDFPGRRLAFYADPEDRAEDAEPAVV